MLLRLFLASNLKNRPETLGEKSAISYVGYRAKNNLHSHTPTSETDDSNSLSISRECKVILNGSIKKKQAAGRIVINFTHINETGFDCNWQEICDSENRQENEFIE